MVTASIVTYHTDPEELVRVLGCLDRSPVATVYVVDNSRSESVRRAVSAFASVRYIPSDNVGYGAGHNKAMREAMREGAVYHIVMNSDIYWDDGTIEKCLDFMEAHTGTGQLMPMVYYPDGRVQRHCKLIPTPADLLFRRLLPRGLMERRAARFQLEFTGYDHVMNVPYLCGCFMLLRMSVIAEVGMFDERFFMYPEDIDLTRRIHERYGTVFFPGASITHVYGEASHRSLRMFWIHAVNMVRYFNKWGWFRDPGRRLYNSRLLQAEGYTR